MKPLKVFFILIVLVIMPASQDLNSILNDNQRDINEFKSNRYRSYLQMRVDSLEIRMHEVEADIRTLKKCVRHLMKI